MMYHKRGPNCYQSSKEKDTLYPVDYIKFFPQRIRCKPWKIEFLQKALGKMPFQAGRRAKHSEPRQEVCSPSGPPRATSRRGASARLSVPGLAPALAAVFPRTSCGVGELQAKTWRAFLLPKDSALNPVGNEKNWKLWSRDPERAGECLRKLI